MSRILYFDCFSGASGDMVLGALLDAGLPIDALRRALESLTGDRATLSARRVSRAGISATKFVVGLEADAGRDTDVPSRDQTPHAHDSAHARPHDHGHSHDHDHGHEHHSAGTRAHAPHAQGGESGHRSLAEIGRLIDTSSLSASAKARAQDLFRRLGEAEAAIHQVPLDRIHLHEVGAIDSIVDIVGSVFALEWFGVDRVVASPLNLGGGTVRCEHGVFPVPAPATVRLLQGVPVYSSGVDAELVTPTGALLVSAYASSYGPVPPMTIDRVGYGAGDRDGPGTPNVLRVLIGETPEQGTFERVVVLECEIDDMNPQIFGTVMDRLYKAGALEVYFTAVQMKKNRPGTLLTVIAAPERRQPLSAIIFGETTTIGVRYQELDRERLERETMSVDTPFGPIRFKLARLGEAIVNAAPEFDDCARVAADRGLPVKDVQAMATKAYLDRK
jgi:pyridinium-3,5-bisthiocarboxylic acid mononucleotide nickel chelatase